MMTIYLTVHTLMTCSKQFSTAAWTRWK